MEVCNLAGICIVFVHVLLFFFFLYQLDFDIKILYVYSMLKDLFSFSVSLREIMRRATSAARNLAGLDNRDRDVGIPTLAWPPEPSDSAAGNDIAVYYMHFSIMILSLSLLTIVLLI